MKPILLSLVLAGSAGAAAPQEPGVTFIRQNQQESGVVWDMPIVPEADAPPALMNEIGGTVFQLWTIDEQSTEDHLLDQKLIGSYIPKAAIRIKTLDPYKPLPRTRVDQPFTVELEVTGLLSGNGMPVSATSVLLERHIAPFPAGSTSLDPACVLSGAPSSSAYIDANGTTKLRFEASSLIAPDPTTAAGEEHFVIHALTEGNFSQTQLAAGFVQVWPIASGTITGVTPDTVFDHELPEVSLLLKDLYPRSDTYLYLFKGTQVSGAEGTPLMTFPMDRDVCETHTATVSDLDSAITTNGTYTIALISDTIYGRELLCEPVTFSVNRPIPSDELTARR